MPAFLKQPSSNTRSTENNPWKINLWKTVLYDSISLQYLQSFPGTITLKYSWTLAPSAYCNEDYSTLFFYNSKQNWTLGLLFLKFSLIIRIHFCLFSPDFFFSIFQTVVIIYNTRNWSNDTTESQKEKKACFNAHAGGKWNLTVQCIVSKQIRCGH